MQHQLTVRQLAAFEAVAAELHFGRAARRLHIAQPALSRTVRQLESSLGCELLERTTRSVALTPAGQELAARAGHLLDQLSDAAVATQDVAAGRTGRLRIGFTGPAMTSALPRLLRGFAAASPDWRIEVTERSTVAQLRGLGDGDLDVGFFLAGPTVPPALSTAEVARERACVGVPVGHSLASLDAVRLDELADERLILFPRERNQVLYDEIVDAVSSGGRRDVTVTEASTRAVAAGLVAAGLGVSTFSESMAAMCGPDVVLVPQIDPERSTVVLMGWRSDRTNPLAAHLDPDDAGER